jgi:hypothetical protein
MDAFEALAGRIEMQLKVTDAPGMDVRVILNRDAAAAYCDQLRATATLVQEYERCRGALEKIADPDISWGHMKLIARQTLGIDQ